MIRARTKRIRKTRPTTGTFPAKFEPYIFGRTRSILLDGDDPSQNVIINKDLLKAHKDLGAVPQPRASSHSAMSNQEFAWWSNPFLRMLSSPLRACVLTKRYAPKDHLIRVTATLLSPPGAPITPSTPSYITPTDLHHSRYAQGPEGLGAYIVCSRKSIPFLSGKGRHRGIFPGVEVHSMLEDQITAGLQARCAEEAELLAARIRSSPIQSATPLGLAVRRLTVFEYESAVKDGAVFDSNISAILVMPKSEELLDPKTTEKTRMLLCRTTDSEPTPPSALSKLPAPRIPLFFGPNMIQDSSLRARLRAALNQALDAERSALQKARLHIPELQTFANQPYVPKVSTTYALCASRRADVVPLVIALWRLRMWESAY